MLPLLVMVLACSDDAPGPLGIVEPVRPPDVLLVVLDTVRADALSAYGNPRPTSPQVAAVADAGVRFADVTAEGSWTWPSHATLFTGLPPWEHGAHLAPPADGGVQVGPDPFHARALRTDVPTLAEQFSAAGYRTVSVSGNRLIGEDFGLTRGFEHAITPGDDPAVVAAATAALSQPDDRPLLLFVNLYGAHAPFDVQPVSWLREHPLLQPGAQPPWLAPYLTRERTRLNYFLQPAGADRIGLFAYMRGELELPEAGRALLRDVYEGEVSAVDYQLHLLLKAWQAARGGEQIVAVTSDHGELLGERLSMEHGRLVYPELVRIPLVIAAPGRLTAGQVVHTPVQLSQVAPTLLELAGIQDGDSLVDVAAGGAGPPTIRAAAWRDHFWAEQVGARMDQGWRLCRVGSEAVIFGEKQGLELYQIDADPGMHDDLARVEPARAAALRDSGCTFPESAPTADVVASPDALQHLEAMGYIEPSTP